MIEMYKGAMKREGENERKREKILHSSVCALVQTKHRTNYNSR